MQYCSVRTKFSFRYLVRDAVNAKHFCCHNIMPKGGPLKPSKLFSISLRHLNERYKFYEDNALDYMDILEDIFDFGINQFTHNTFCSLLGLYKI